MGIFEILKRMGGKEQKFSYSGFMIWLRDDLIKNIIFISELNIEKTNIQKK